MSKKENQNPPPGREGRGRGKNLVIHIDGACRGNPGPAGIGMVIRDESGNTLLQSGRSIGPATNNIAEYQALIASLQEAAKYFPGSVQVFSDSELMVRQILGIYRVKNPRLQKLFRQAQDLITRFPRFLISSIPREKNREADKLASEAVNSWSGAVET